MMKKIDQALELLDQRLGSDPRRSTIPFRDFLNALSRDPAVVIRNVFQTFHDMIRAYVGDGADEYPDDPESINYVCYDCSRLFVNGADRPFFADRLFANRLISHVESMRRGSQQNKIYIFEGPHGSGKSTFLNNLLRRFEEYTGTPEGSRFETVWRLDRNLIGTPAERSTLAVFQKLLDMEQSSTNAQYEGVKNQTPFAITEDFIEVGCPSHDHPLLMVPKNQRRPLLDELFENDAFKWKLFTEKEYEWVFKDKPCTICTSLYEALLDKAGSPRKVFDMIFARPYVFNRRLGEGISVFSPGDKPMRTTVLTNDILQSRINSIFKDSNQVRYLCSRYAKTNNGIYALMDIKSHNTERLIELHNIISEGVHKVEDIEENVNSLFLALMNPEDKKNIAEFQSFSDRIEYIKIPYVLDINTEVEIYRNIFGRHIDESFLPRVLHNFARIIIGSRMRAPSTAMMEWIDNPKKYRSYCDKDLLLLKMEIYTGYIPPWLDEDERKKLTFKRRKKIIGESETEGDHGFSGRDSIKIFNEFYSAYAKESKLITMADLCKFFKKICKEYNDPVPEGFMDSLLGNYDYTVLQEVKESLYFYNEEQIAREIKNYLFAINFEIGAVETCKFTGDRIHVTEELMESIESKLLDVSAGKTQQLAFRRETQREYTTRTLTQEILVEGLDITESDLYAKLHDRYIHNLKEKVLDPMIGNENFRRAVKDFNSAEFKTYDEKIRTGVEFLMDNLCKKFGYTQFGAREVCIYVIDSQLGIKNEPKLEENEAPIELAI